MEIVLVVVVMIVVDSGRSILVVVVTGTIFVSIVADTFPTTVSAASVDAVFVEDKAVEITTGAAETGTIGIPAPLVGEVDIAVEMLLMLVVSELSVVTVSEICQNVLGR